MKKILLPVVASLLTFSASAQFSGYLGKKNLLEAGFNVHIPVLYDFFYIWNNDDDFYKEDGGSLSSGFDRFNPGVRVGYLRLMGNHFGVGMDFSYDAINTRMKFYDPNNPDDYSYSSYEKCENLQYRSLTFNPKIEFTNAEGLLPVGISHQLGFGFRFISLVEKQYLNQYTLNDGFNYTYVSKQEDYSGYFTATNPNRFVYKSFNYTLNFRRPLSNHLLINMGFRYSLNIGRQKYINYYNYTNFYDHVASLLNKQQFSSVLSFNIGASYAF
ncbi:MAG: hypothetical protein ACO1O6_15840 [Bacteroidota bacterium]